MWSQNAVGVRCRCGKKGASLEKPEVVTLYKSFIEFKELQRKYNLVPAINTAKLRPGRGETAAKILPMTIAHYGGVQSSEDALSDVDTTNSVSTDTPRHQEKLYLVPAMASCVGKLASVAVKAKLDSGAEAANWIEPALVEKLKLRKRKIPEKEKKD